MKCYIFDLDGTLADDQHRWHHVTERSDWESYYAACSADKPIQHVLYVLWALQRSGYGIVIVTGRSESIRKETEEWLLQHNVLHCELIMRKRNDKTKNGELKQRALADLRQRGYEPLMAFEDLPAAVAAWRAAGLPCAQVAEPKEWSQAHP